jgi:hypothetical protein
VTRVAGSGTPAERQRRRMTHSAGDAGSMQSNPQRTPERPGQNARRRSAQSRPGQLRQRAEKPQGRAGVAGAWVHGVTRARTVPATPRADRRTTAPDNVEAGSPGRWHRPVRARDQRALKGMKTSREASGRTSAPRCPGFPQSGSTPRRTGGGRDRPDRRWQIDPRCSRAPFPDSSGDARGGHGPVRRSAGRPRTTPLN